MHIVTYKTFIHVRWMVYRSCVVTYKCIKHNLHAHVTFYNTSSQLRYWFDGDDIRTASDVRVGKQDQAVIYGIQKNYLYCLRVLGFSTGGDGTMSELVYFTLGEQCLHVWQVWTRLLYSSLPQTSFNIQFDQQGRQPLGPFHWYMSYKNFWWVQ